MSFNSLGLSDALCSIIQSKNYLSPYPIQVKAIPAILKGQDLLGIAKTGSGKTEAFMLPLLEKVLRNPSEKSRNIDHLVLVPTRELAAQILRVAKEYTQNLEQKIHVVAVHGGVSINPQMKALYGTDILIATPGRLLDLLDKNALSLENTKTLVLDEADKMLNMGFEDEMQEVFAALPMRRQNLLFSATLNEEIEGLFPFLLDDPVRIQLEEDPDTLSLIEQAGYAVSEERKGPFLRYFIKTQEPDQVLIFVSSKDKAEKLMRKLLKNGIDAKAIHGDKSQGARNNALEQFRNKKLKVLVATDLISRGIDISFLPMVINYELPRSPKDYIHRIGRTGRAENPGIAISLISPSEEHHFTVIQKKMGTFTNLEPTEDINLQGY